MITRIAVLVASASALVWMGLGPVPEAPMPMFEGVCTNAPEVAGADCGAIGDDNDDGYITPGESGWVAITLTASGGDDDQGKQAKRGKGPIRDAWQKKKTTGSWMNPFGGPRKAITHPGRW